MTVMFMGYHGDEGSFATETQSHIFPTGRPKLTIYCAARIALQQTKKHGYTNQVSSRDHTRPYQSMSHEPKDFRLPSNLLPSLQLAFAQRGPGELIHALPAKLIPLVVWGRHVLAEINVIQRKPSPGNGPH